MALGILPSFLASAWSNYMSALFQMFIYIYFRTWQSSIHAKDHTPTTRPDHNIEQCIRGSFYVPQNCEQWRVARRVLRCYRRCPGGLESLTKAAFSTQLFRDPECWSGQGSNTRPPAVPEYPQYPSTFRVPPDTQPTELIGYSPS